CQCSHALADSLTLALKQCFSFRFGARAREGVRVKKPQKRHGKTERAWTDPQPQSACCSGRKIKSQRKTTAANACAGQEKSRVRTPRNRPVDRQILCTSICQPSRQRLQRCFRTSLSISSRSRQS